MPTVKANGIEIYYETHGSGEPLLLIMGLAGHAGSWEMQVPALSKEYHVIAFDNRGAGRSEKPDKPYSIPQMADDTVGLLDELGIRSAHVFGMSMGGMIAQDIALRHPDRVRALVLSSTMCGGPHAVMAGPRLIQQWASMATMPMPLMMEAGLSLLYSDEYVAQHKDRLVKRGLEMAHLMPPGFALQRQFMAVASFNTYARLKEIHHPTLVMTGNADKIMPAENASILSSQIPGAESVVFPNVGHGLLMEIADEVNETVLGFLKRHDGHFVRRGG